MYMTLMSSRMSQRTRLLRVTVGAASALAAVLAANGLSSRFATLAPLFAARRASALAQGDAGTCLPDRKQSRAREKCKCSGVAQINTAEIAALSSSLR